MSDRHFLAGYLFARRSASSWTPGSRKRPKMPPGPWRIAAALCFALGAVASWLLFRGGDSGVLVLRVIFGGLVAFVIGMYIVETVWKRSTENRQNPDHVSPIGRRR